MLASDMIWRDPVCCAYRLWPMFEACQAWCKDFFPSFIQCLRYGLWAISISKCLNSCGSNPPSPSSQKAFEPNRAPNSENFLWDAWPPYRASAPLRVGACSPTGCLGQDTAGRSPGNCINCGRLSRFGAGFGTWFNWVMVLRLFGENTIHHWMPGYSETPWKAIKHLY